MAGIIKDLIVVGPGELGYRVATFWKRAHPEAKVHLKTRSDILFLKHDSNIFRLSSNPVCGSWTGLNISSHFAFLLVVVQLNSPRGKSRVEE